MKQHKCLLLQASDTELRLTKFQKLRLISADNPLSLSNLRSENAILDEQLRHLKVNKYAIHPFSKFKAWYDMFLIYLYLSVLITKPLDAAYVRASVVKGTYAYAVYTAITDLFCWMDIMLHFYIGFEVQVSQIVELRSRYIVKNYLLSLYFLCDVLSSVPKCMLYYFTKTALRDIILGVISFTGLLKVSRIISLLGCIRNTAEYFEIKSRGKLFLLNIFTISLMSTHWMASMQFIVPKLFRLYFRPDKQKDRTSWFYEDKGHGPLYSKSVFLQYNHCFFKSSAYLLGIRLRTYDLEKEEEYVLVILAYFIGKIIMGFMWIILAVTILNSRLMDIKFAEVLNQLEEYMRQKQLPVNLRDRITQYFLFKYRGRYFKEALITSLLSDNLRKETNLHVCKSLIKNVSLFSELGPTDISKIVDILTPEIFLPNDTIIHAGTHGDAMYFLSSGTVAVYTRSGKEVCHLQDGAFFGEISLVLKGQLRLATIMAIETTQVYRLSKRDLEKYFSTNKSVMSKILAIAEKRLKQTTNMEEEYKQMLFEQSYRRIDS